MSILFFGGSFNPIHNAHLQCAAFVGEKRGFGRIMLIPSASPPHKPLDPDLASSADRMAMCRLAAGTMPGFEVSDIEMRRTGPSYTLDTVRELRAAGIDPVNWLIGADMLMLLPSWHRPLELIREANLIIMARPGWTMDWSMLGAEYQPLKKHVVEAPQIDISATDIRRRVRLGESIAGLTPAPVAQYIAEHGLYRAEDGLTELSSAR